MEVREIIAEYNKNGTKNLINRPTDVSKTGALDSKQIANFFVEKVGGVESFAKHYSQWGREYNETQKQISGIQDGYSSKDVMKDAAQKLRNLAASGSIYNYVNTTLGGKGTPNFAESLNKQINALEERSDFYSQWESEEDYNDWYNNYTYNLDEGLKTVTELSSASLSKQDYETIKNERNTLYNSLVSGYVRAHYSRQQAEQMASKDKRIVDYDKTLKTYSEEIQTKLTSEKDGLAKAVLFRLNELSADQLKTYAKAIGWHRTATTTEDGKEITWKSLYDIKAEGERLDAVYKDKLADSPYIKYYEELLKVGRLNDIKEILDYQEKIRSDKQNSFMKSNKLLPLTETVLKEEEKKRDLTLRGFDLKYGASHELNDEEVEFLKDFYDYKKSKIEFDTGHPFYETVLDAKKAKWSEWAMDNPVSASFGSLIDNFQGGVQGFVGNTVSMLTGNGIDMNASYNEAMLRAQTMRAAVAQTIQTADYENWRKRNPDADYDAYSKIAATWGDVGSLAYNVGMSFADMLVAAGFGSITGVGNVLSRTIMSSSAVSATVLQKKEQGYSDEEAYALGVVAGIAEMITEKYSLDALFSSGSKGFAYLIKNFVIEGSEEGASYLINFMADTMLMKDESEWAKLVQSYMETEKDYGAAFRKAFMDVLSEGGLEVLAGALCGGFAGGAGAVINYSNAKATGNNIKSKGLLDSVAQLGLESNNKTVVKYANQLMNDTTLSDAAIGNMVAEIFNDVETQTISDISAALVRRGYKKSVAAELGDALTKSVVGKNMTNHETYVAMSDAKAVEIAKTEGNIERARMLNDVYRVMTIDTSSVDVDAIIQTINDAQTQANDVAAPASADSVAGAVNDTVSGTATESIGNAYTPTSKVDENGRPITAVIDGVEVDLKTKQPVLNEPNLTDTSGPNTYLAEDADKQPFMHTDEHTRVENIAEKLGMKLQWSSKIGAEGLYSKGVVYLNPHCEHPKLMIFKHEFTHYLENSPWYNSFVKYLKSTQVYQDWIENNHFGEAAYTEELKKDYEAAGLPCDVTHEIVANFVAERVLGGVGGFGYDANGKLVNRDPVVMEALSRFAETHQAWYDAILTHIKDIAAKLKSLYYSVSGKTAAQQSESQELDEIHRRLVQLKDTVNTKKAAQNEVGQFMVKIDSAVDDIINNKGKLQDPYNQREISAVPENIAKMVSAASEGKIDISKKHLALNGSDTYHEFVRHSNASIEQSRDQIPFDANTFKNAINAFYNPDFVECVFSDAGNPTQRQSFAYAKKVNGYYVVVEAVGGRKNPNVVPVEILHFTEHKWNRMISEGKTIGEMLHENNDKLFNALDIELNKKNRVTAAQFASKEAIASTLHSPLSNPIIPDTSQNVNKNSSANTDNVSNGESTPDPKGQAYVSASRHTDLSEQYKAGKITLEEYQAEVDARDKAQAAEIRKLRQQKKNLQDARDQLQERFKHEHGGWNENKALEVLRGILKEYPTKVAATKLRPAYFELLTYIQNHPNATMEELEGKAIDLIANPILDSMKTLKKEEAQEMLADIKKMRFRLSDEQLAEIKYIYGRVQHWRHSVQGKVRITDDADAMTLDQAWKEMSELYPDRFDAEANPLDMPALLDDIITVAAEEISPFEYMPRETMAREIALRAIGGYHNVPKVILNADKVQREINIEREKNIKQSQRQKRSQLRQQIRSLYTDFKKRLFNGNDNVYVPEEFRQVVCDVLECLTYIVSDGNKESVTAKLKALSGELAHVNSEGSKFGREFMTEEFLEDAEHFSGYANAIANTLSGKSASELTLTEMQDIVNLCSDIKYALQHATAIIRNGRAESLADAADSLVKQQEAVSEKEKINWFNRENLNPLRIALRMGEYNEDSVIVKLFRDIEQGYIKQARFQADSNKRFEEVIAQDPQAYEKMCNEVIEWKPVNSELKRVRMTKMQAMQILMTYDRERNGVTRHLEEGGVRIVDAELVLKGKYQEAKAKAQKLIVTEGVYNSIREQLFSSNDATFIKDYWDVAYEQFNHYSRDAINEVSMQRQHRMIATTKNYIPMVVDGDYVEANLEGVSFNYSLANTGSLKSVEKGAVAPVMIEGLNFVVRRNIDTTAKINGLLIPVENCKKVINQTTDTGVKVHGVLSQRWGAKAYGVIEQVIADVQTRRKHDKIDSESDLAELFRKAERGFVGGVLPGRVTTVVSQFSAYFSAGAYIEQGHLLKTLKDLPKNSTNYESIEAEIDAHTPLHMERRDEITMPELRDIVSQDSLIKKTFDKLNDKKGLWALNLYNQITRADRQITRLLWLACKSQVNAKTPKSEVGTDSYWKEVTDLYERVILDTQSTYSPLHRAEVSKTQNRLVKYFGGFFKTEPLQHYGTVHDAYHKMDIAKRKGDADMLRNAQKQFARTIVAQVETALSYVLLKFVAGVLIAKLSKRWRDDDEELTAKSISKELARTGGEALLSSFLPMTSEYVFSIGEALYGILTGEGVEYYASNVLDMPTFTMVNDFFDSLYKTGTSVADLFNKNSNESEEDKAKSLLKDLRALAENIGNFAGIPVENIGTIFDGVYKHATAIIKGEDLSYALDMGVERSNAIESHRMYEALLDGDTEKYNEIYDSLIAKGLTKAQIKNGVARIIADTNSKVSEAAEISRERDKLADDEQSKDKYNDLTTQLNTYILSISGEGEEEIPVDFVTKAIELKVSDLEGERLSSADKTKIETTAADLSDKYNDELQQSDYYKGATPLEQSAISSKVEKYANAVAKAEVDTEYDLSNDYTAIHILETEDDVSVVELLVLYETADTDEDGKVTVKEYTQAVSQSNQLTSKQKQFLISLKKAKNDEARKRIWDNYRNN